MSDIFNTFKIYINSTRYTKQIIALLTDSALCIIAVWLALYLKLDQFVSLKGNFFWPATFSNHCYTIFSCWFYRTMFRY